jgi:hypothetical protein
MLQNIIHIMSNQGFEVPGLAAWQAGGARVLHMPATGMMRTAGDDVDRVIRELVSVLKLDREVLPASSRD